VDIVVGTVDIVGAVVYFNDLFGLAALPLLTER